jgi:hypothetical protein
MVVSRVHDKEGSVMANVESTLKELSTIDGVVGAALVDWSTGLALGSVPSSVDMENSIASGVDLIRAALRIRGAVESDDEIEDIVATLGRTFHVVRPLFGRSKAELFLYVILDKAEANLLIAKHQMKKFDDALEV